MSTVRKNVYELAQERLRTVFSEFDNVYISFSGGKDSGVLLNLCIDYMRRHNITRKLGVFHMDYEVQYDETTRYIERVFNANRDILEIIPCLHSFQSADMHFHVPILLAPVGGKQTRHVGTQYASRKLHFKRLSVLFRQDVGLRISANVRTVVPPAQTCRPHMLPRRNTHPGELQPLAYHIRRQTHVHLHPQERPCMQIHGICTYQEGTRRQAPHNGLL